MNSKAQSHLSATSRSRYLLPPVERREVDDVEVRNWIGELWSTNKEVIVVQVDQPKWTVFGILHFDRL